MTQKHFLQKKIFEALVLTWVLIEDDKILWDVLGHVKNRKTGKTLHETVKGLIELHYKQSGEKVGVLDKEEK